MNREVLKNIKDSNIVFVTCFDFIKSFYGWFLNYIVAIIPVWHIRKLFYVISGMKIGKGSRIGLRTRVIRPSKIQIGERSIINEYCHLDGRGGLTIGDDCSISIYSKIITASHKANSKDFEYYEAPVSMGDHVWIGCNAIILDGSILNDGCIIGAGAVIKGTVEENAIYIGNPATKVKERNKDLQYQINFHPFFR
ncbi:MULTISPECIES: acyltransferase [unclassified Butyrivibrio]|uniref:acyltransferase n=1 Tax=unclassified Butyrivibrio TaxID=2639466 RepID=UPI0004265915|nr:MULTISPECIES: acyltransferase [unclassified Butyrivibrio]